MNFNPVFLLLGALPLLTASQFDAFSATGQGPRRPHCTQCHRPPTGSQGGAHVRHRHMGPPPGSQGGAHVCHRHMGPPHRVIVDIDGGRMHLVRPMRPIAISSVGQNKFDCHAKIPDHLWSWDSKKSCYRLGVITGGVIKWKEESEFKTQTPPPPPPGMCGKFGGHGNPLPPHPGMHGCFGGHKGPPPLRFLKTDINGVTACIVKPLPPLAISKNARGKSVGTTNIPDHFWSWDSEKSCYRLGVVKGDKIEWKNIDDMKKP